MAPDSTLMIRIKRSLNRLCYLWGALPVFLSVILLVSPSADAQEGVPTLIYTLNGVLVKQADALANQVALERLVRPQLSPEEDSATSFDFIYNDTQGFDDVLEVLELSKGLELSRFWRMFAGLEPFEDRGQDFYNQLADNALFNASRRDPDTMAQVKTMPRNAIKNECNRVVVVAHSQGNLYLNSAVADPTFLTDTERRSFGTVNVAVPDSRVQKNVTEFSTTAYTTLKLDLIITVIDAFARFLQGLPPPLPWNTDNGYINPFARTGNHNFTMAYLADEPSRGKIVQDTVRTMRNLSVPDCIVIQTAVCYQIFAPDEPDVIFRIDTTGIATSGLIRSLIGRPMSPDLFFPPVCTGWTFTPLGPDSPWPAFCERYAGNPPKTLWSNIDFKSGRFLPVTSASAELRLRSPESPGGFPLLAETAVPLTCPGSYPK